MEKTGDYRVDISTSASATKELPVITQKRNGWIADYSEELCQGLYSLKQKI